MPRRVVPIWLRPSRASPAVSSSRWYGMIMCALALTRRPLRSTPRLRSSSISSVRTFGSITTPLPITHFLPGYRIPDGIKRNFQTAPSRTMVWPALLPPWKRMTRSACSARRSVTLPLPSSPHWAPRITIPLIGGGEDCRGAASRRAAVGDGRGLVPAGGPCRLPREAVVGGRCRVLLGHDGQPELLLLAPVLAVHGQRVAAHLVQPRDRPGADLRLERGVLEVGGED